MWTTYLKHASINKKGAFENRTTAYVGHAVMSCCYNNLSILFFTGFIAAVPTVCWIQGHSNRSAFEFKNGLVQVPFSIFKVGMGPHMALWLCPGNRNQDLNGQKRWKSLIGRMLCVCGVCVCVCVCVCVWHLVANPYASPVLHIMDCWTSELNTGIAVIDFWCKNCLPPHLHTTRITTCTYHVHSHIYTTTNTTTQFALVAGMKNTTSASCWRSGGPGVGEVAVWCWDKSNCAFWGGLCHTELLTFALHGLIMYSDHIQYIRHSRSIIGSARPGYDVCLKDLSGWPKTI